MGGLRSRIRNLEHAAEDETAVLVLEDTGEEVRVPSDAPMRWAAWEWRRGAGEDPEPDPLAERIEALRARGAREKNPDRDGRVLSGGHRGG